MSEKKDIELPSEVKNEPHRQWILWAIMIGFPLIQVLFAGSIIEFGQSRGGRGWVEFFTWIILLEWAIFGVMVFDLRRQGLKLKDIGFPVVRRWEYGVIGIVVFALVAFILIVGDSKNPFIVDGPWILPRFWEEKLLMVAAAITAGTCEETIFRGYLYNGLRRSGHAIWLAILLTTISFVLIHGLHQPMILLAFRVLVSLGFTSLYLWRKSLRLPIIIHIAIDAQLALSV